MPWSAIVYRAADTPLFHDRIRSDLSARLGWVCLVASVLQIGAGDLARVEARGCMALERGQYNVKALRGL